MEMPVKPGLKNLNTKMKKINCGWPQTRFIKQNNSLEEALKELSRIGDEIEAAGHTEEDEEMERDLLYGYSFKKA